MTVSNNFSILQVGVIMSVNSLKSRPRWNFYSAGLRRREINTKYQERPEIPFHQFAETFLRSSEPPRGSRAPSRGQMDHVVGSPMRTARRRDETVGLTTQRDSFNGVFPLRNKTARSACVRRGYLTAILTETQLLKDETCSIFSDLHVIVSFHEN